MKKLLIVSLVLNATLLAALAPLCVLKVSFAEGTPPPVDIRSLINGDVNCDGRMNVTDAILILDHVFFGRTPPCPLVDLPGLVAQVQALGRDLGVCRSELVQANLRAGTLERSLGASRQELDGLRRQLADCEASCAPLPATNQQLCYGTGPDVSVRNAVPCTSSEFPGQDGYFHAGCARLGRFRPNRDGTISDRCTGLVWRRVNLRADWQDALGACDALLHGDQDDWRLPNAFELLSLYDFSFSHVSFQPMGLVKRCWSSTTAPPTVGDPAARAFVVDFECCGGELLSRQPKDEVADVLAVRSE